MLVLFVQRLSLPSSQPDVCRCLRACSLPQGWLRIVCDDRGATLRDGVSIDEAVQVGRLNRGAVVRFVERGAWSPLHVGLLGNGYADNF
jgi:hypothetical protein